jgi:hypothetical protein
MDNGECGHCVNSACHAEQWLVLATPGHRDVWQIVPDAGSRPWVVAASVPICPLCGSNLETLPVVTMARDIMTSATAIYS